MPFQHDSQNFANNSIGISLMSNAVNALLTTTNNSLILAQAAFEAMNSKVLLSINTISYANSTYSILANTSANVNGNNYVVITGENFSVNANVIIGTTYALSTNVVNTTTIFAQLPTLNVGNYTLYIVNNDNFCVLRSNGINYN